MGDEQSVSLMLTKGEEVDAPPTEDRRNMNPSSQQKTYPAARVLLLRVLQVVVGICLLVLSGIAGLDDAMDVLVMGCITATLVVSAAALSIYQSRGFGGYWKPRGTHSGPGGGVSATQVYVNIITGPTAYMLREPMPCQYKVLKVFEKALWVAGYAATITLGCFAWDLCFQRATHTQYVVGALQIWLIVTNLLCGIVICIVNCQKYTSFE